GPGVTGPAVLQQRLGDAAVPAQPLDVQLGPGGLDRRLDPGAQHVADRPAAVHERHRQLEVLGLVVLAVDHGPGAVAAADPAGLPGGDHVTQRSDAQDRAGTGQADRLAQPAVAPLLAA